MLNGHVRFSIAYIPIILLLVFAPLTEGSIQQGVLVLVALVYLLSIVRKGKILITKEYRGVLLVGVLWVVWQLCVFFIHGSGIVRLIQVLTLILIVVGIVGSYSSSEKIIALMKIIAVVYGISWLAYIPFSNFSIEYSAYFGNSNVLGLMAFNMLTILFLAQFKNNTIKRILIVIMMACILLSGSRATLLGLVIMLLSFIIFKKSKNDVSLKRKSFWLFWGIIVGIFIFTIVYSTLLGTQLGTQLNELSRNLFGKNFFSGRQILWEQVIELIKQKPIFGYGLGKVPSDYFNTNLSSHNLYLQTVFQSGIAGVILLVVFLWQLYILCRKRKNEYSYVVMAYLLGVLVRECFEVSITQNNWPEGFFLWIVLGIGIMPSENKSR